MYKSPIEISMFPMEPTYRSFQEEINGHLETRITATIQEKYNINCDKEELIKALKYDRQQYDKGYADAKRTYQITVGTPVHNDKLQLIDELMNIKKFFQNATGGTYPICIEQAIQIIEKLNLQEPEQE